jgi:predicted translin family RNA/ssDNA-binding protein
MLDEKEFAEMVEEYSRSDSIREELIKLGRDVIKTSKQVIYNTHRNDLAKAEISVKDIKKLVAKFNDIAKKDPELLYSGTYKSTLQEYVEAITYFSFVKNKKIPSKKELEVSSECYLLGLCDLTGELVRNAILSAIKEKYSEVKIINELVEKIFNNMLQFDFRNSELRKKFDSVKYDLKKLEDLVLQLKLKDKI